jgi:hypothetical protein
VFGRWPRRGVADAGRDGNLHDDRHTYASPDRDADRHGHGRRDGNRHADAGTDGGADRYPRSHGDPDGDRHTDGDTDGNADE